MKLNLANLLKPETSLEREIIRDEEFIEGANYGKPRPGHPEGQVAYHIQEVLQNVDKYSDENNRKDLRLIAFIHDTFKNKVDHNQPKSGENHHAMIARRFAEKYHLPEHILDIIELHDEAYNAWQQGGRKGNWYKAEERARKLINRLGENIDLYLVFYQCDNETGDKEQENCSWFTNRVSVERHAKEWVNEVDKQKTINRWKDMGLLDDKSE